MGKLYWYLLLSVVSFIVITHGWIYLEAGAWYYVVLISLNILALPWWIAEAIKAIKELEVNNDRVK